MRVICCFTFAYVLFGCVPFSRELFGVFRFVSLAETSVFGMLCAHADQARRRSGDHGLLHAANWFWGISDAVLASQIAMSEDQ